MRSKKVAQEGDKNEKDLLPMELELNPISRKEIEE
jgi:hypothetical protein